MLRRSPPASAALPPPGEKRRRREHSIGVSVSDTNIDARMATVTTTANSLKMRPMTPPIRSTGMNTATSEIEMEMMVKPISRAPFSAASKAPSPSSSMCRKMFSSMTMASSTTSPTASVRPISEMLSMEKPNRYITASVAISEIGTATAGMIVAATRRRNRKMTITTSATVSSSVNCTSPTAARIEVERSLSKPDLCGRRHLVLE